MTIEHHEKIGLGTWDLDNKGTALNDLDRLGIDWYYNWTEIPLWDCDATPDGSSFVAMIQNEAALANGALTRLKASGAQVLLGFNEPDNINQANMTVARALQLWPQLEATGLRLGSPVASPESTLGPDSWLGRFMAGAEAQGLRVDFINVHYYTDTPDIGAFKAWLEEVYAQYQKPIWVTEWSLADWTGQKSFTWAEQAAFAEAGAEMMDDLDFVERQSWFAGYEGGDGWYLNSGVFNGTGGETTVGNMYSTLLAPTPTIQGTAGNDTLTGTSKSENIFGGAGDDLLKSGGGYDTIRGEGGNDRLEGGSGSSKLLGGTGNDTYVVTSSGTTVVENAGEGTDTVQSQVSFTLGANIENLTMTGSAAVSGTGNGGANVMTGNASGNALAGGGGNDTLSGGAGNDTLNGGSGADQLNGGGGDDLYVVDQAGDVVTEAAGGGTDTVNSGVSWTLGAQIENLVLTGSSATNGTGNDLANRLTGNAADNILTGGVGNDRLYGKSGNDNLRGGTEADLLDGGAGNDTLTGGGQADTFVFAHPSGQDRITDFQDNIDTLQFDDSLWSGRSLSVSDVLWFAKVSGGAVVFDFGVGNVLTIDGLTSVASLSDDITII
ncbi:hypothetical protein LAZ40_09910 [Cereibacter sphaeroides]|uniref:glycosyl hydrolase n=1 Tax=Cereibacter sphaeroides TaxID=1063 RepID=UPI001F2ABE59|nr:glycosyl hydrolase [Cereibacter sphaeroides]MCE6959366.1 hypothetical protein [Cereibacter sphaeroides]MCE6972958.1 hypothetical protein [Cereibacter sphaeroides]